MGGVTGAAAAVGSASLAAPGIATSSAVFSDASAVDDLTAGWGLEEGGGGGCGGGGSGAEEVEGEAVEATSAVAPVNKRSRRSAPSPSLKHAAGGGGSGAAGEAGAPLAPGAAAAAGAADSLSALLLPPGPDGTRALQGLRWVHLPEGALGEGPCARWAHAAASADGGRHVVLYGGQDAAGRVRGDTWTLDVEGGGEGELWSRKVEDSSEAGAGAGAPRAWHAMVAVPERSMVVAIGRVDRVAAAEGGASASAASASASAAPAAGEVDVDIFDTTIELWYPPVSNGKAPSRRAGAAAALMSHGVLPGACSAQRTPEPMVVVFGGLANRGAHEVRACAPRPCPCARIPLLHPAPCNTLSSLPPPPLPLGVGQ